MFVNKIFFIIFTSWLLSSTINPVNFFWLVGEHTIMYSVWFGYNEWRFFFILNLKTQSIKMSARFIVRILTQFSTILGVKVSNNLSTFNMIQFFWNWQWISRSILKLMSIPFMICTLSTKGPIVLKSCRTAKGFNFFRFSKNDYWSKSSSVLKFRGSISTYLQPCWAGWIFSDCIVWNNIVNG